LINFYGLKATKRFSWGLEDIIKSIF